MISRGLIDEREIDDEESDMVRNVHHVEADGWSPDGSKITSAENLQTIQSCLEEQGPIIVEHWFYGGRGPPIASSSMTTIRLSSTWKMSVVLVMRSTFGASASHVVIRINWHPASVLTTTALSPIAVHIEPAAHGIHCSYKRLSRIR
jgi:hypothetical protein